MNTTLNNSEWTDANQRYLTASLAVVSAALQRHADDRHARGAAAATTDEAAKSLLSAGHPDLSLVERHVVEARAAMPGPAALDVLGELFQLSPFEHHLLLLCAGLELEGTFAALCAEAQGSADRAYPTFSLALAALPAAHWSALTPSAPLRYWRLIDVGSARTLVDSPLRIDECILHYLTGTPHVDENLIGFVEPAAAPERLVPSQQRIVEAAATAWTSTPHGLRFPVLQLCGADNRQAELIGASLCAGFGWSLYRLPSSLLPTSPVEFETLVRLWQRESLLGRRALLLDCHDVEGSDGGRVALVDRAIRAIGGPLIVTGRERREMRGRETVTFDVRNPTRDEQRTLWSETLARCSESEQVESLSATSWDGPVAQLAGQFDLSPRAIEAACHEALGSNGFDKASAVDRISHRLWAACRSQARPRLDDLAQRIETKSTWDDLVLPELQFEILRDLVRHVRHRATVYDQWGFAAKSSRGLGISALFAGSSGTGKTLAAEVVANQLQLDLYRIDLSQVVSKYIGETEKNLRRVFDAADEGGAVLLFDEADALFGKRSEVKDSHDRYANIEISYLLQRMEAYRGLAILTTNMKNSLDSAFLRRIRFVVQFPFPDAEHRVEIWRRIFPNETPTKALDANKLGQLNIPGGNIRNIALGAAFLAADDGQPLCMHHILNAARTEYTKLEKSLTNAETRGWT